MTAQFGYLLNAMERAACEHNPAKHDYKGKRLAVLGYVSALEAERDRLRAENEAMRTALKVIDTWARFDAEPRSGFSVAALDPKHVIELCNKALATPSEEK